MCSSDSGGSVYIRLLDLLLLFSTLAEFIILSLDSVLFPDGGRLTSPAKVKPVGWRSKDDSLAVLR